MPGKMNACVYYGAGRNMTTEDLRSYDVVLTTYQTVVTEHENTASTAGEGSRKKRKIQTSLLDMPWKVSKLPMLSSSYSLTVGRVLISPMLARHSR